MSIRSKSVPGMSNETAPRIVLAPIHGVYELADASSNNGFGEATTRMASTVSPDYIVPISRAIWARHDGDREERKYRGGVTILRDEAPARIRKSNQQRLAVHRRRLGR